MKKVMSTEEKEAFVAGMKHIYGSKYTSRTRTHTNDDGQPLNLRFRHKDIEVRQRDELIGLLKGIIADQEILQSEVFYLSKWLDFNTSANSFWPGDVLHNRIKRALKDNIIDDEELVEIRSIILDIVNGGKELKSAEVVSAAQQEYASIQDLTSTLPLDNPVPEILFQNQSFCFTGKLIWGKRRDAEDAVVKLGGLVKGDVLKSLNFLVLGQISSRDWLHSTHGLKISSAVKFKESDCDIKIISEQSWAEALREAGEA